MEVIVYLVLIALGLFFFGGLLKKLTTGLNDAMEVGINAGTVNVKVYGMKERARLGAELKKDKYKDVQSWDELDKMLG